MHRSGLNGDSGGAPPAGRGRRVVEWGLVALLALAVVGCGAPWEIGDVLLAIGSIAMVGALFARQLHGRSSAWGRFEWGLLVAFATLAAYQLVPLPPGTWVLLAGRESVASDLAAAGLPAAWRPLGLDPDGASRGVAALLPALAMLLGARELSARGVARLAHWLVVLATAAAVLGIAQVAGGPQSPLRLHAFHNLDGALGFFANRNHQAALLYMALPVAFALATDAATPYAPHGTWVIRRVVAALAIPVMLLGLVLTTSRAGTGLGLVALLGGLILVLSARPPARRGRVLLAGVVAGGLVLALFAAWPVVSERLQQDIAGDSRWWLFASTWDLRSGYGWWGSGLGSFEAVFRPLPENQQVVEAYVNHAHNDWLELWIELGWVFPLLALIAVAVLLPAVRRAWRGAPHLPAIILARAAACSVVLVAFHSLVDWPLRTGANLAVFALLVAILLRCPEPR